MKETPANAQGLEKEKSRPRFTTTTSTHAHDIYSAVARDDEIQEFLSKADEYDVSKRRWCTPELPNSVEDVVCAVSRVFSAIVQRFVQPKAAGVERHVMRKSEALQAKHASGSEAQELPSIIVQAAGPSFGNPDMANSTLNSTPSGSNIGYSNTASCSKVKLDSNIGDAKENVDEMEVFARHLFRVQPNRIFVRSLIITEKHARLVHFDRSGPQITPLIDIHQHPETLVRLIVGLSSTDERLLGLDNSVQWTIVDGKKTQGYITMTGPGGAVKTYPIVDQIAVPRHSICTRGTTCWIVCDPETSEEYVVKDSWREDHLAAEHELLEHVKDIPGIVHMVSREPDRGETKDFRCPSTVEQYKNRKASRVLLELYGKSVEYFSSTLQVLYAFRDAIAAHRQLLQRGILHRDISLNNLLLGKPGAPEGERGVIIDLDLAFLATEEKPRVKADQTIGTLFFQSIPVIDSCVFPNRAWEQDYLDDLEAFLYCFAFVLLCYRPDGSLIPAEEEGPSIPWSWGEENPALARMIKWRFFGAGTIVWDSSRIVQTNWGPTCGDLFDKFRQWILETRTKKGLLITKARGTANTDPLRPFRARRNEHYSTVVEMFDQAIAEILSSKGPLSSPPPAADVELTQDPALVTLAQQAVARLTGSPLEPTDDNLIIPSLAAPPTSIGPTPKRSKGKRPLACDGAKASFTPGVSSIGPPPPVGVPTQPRRSSRIRDLRQARDLPSPNVPPMTQPLDPMVFSLPRRSTEMECSGRGQKRRRVVEG